MVEPIRLPMRRYDMLHLIKAYRPSIDTAVEIGVLKGESGRYISNILQPKKLIGIDPYQLYENYTDKPSKEFNDQEQLDKLAAQMIEAYKTYNKPRHSELVRARNHQVVNTFADGSLDYVYLDGDHKYDSVKQDIKMWYPKLKVGAILSGHDYCIGSVQEKFGVIEAVQEFVAEHKLRLAVTTENFPAWIVCKDNRDLFF